MHQQVAARSIIVRKRPADQPPEEGITVRRAEYCIESVARTALVVAVGEREQVQVVIAEHDDCVVGECAHVAQDSE